MVLGKLFIIVINRQYLTMEPSDITEEMLEGIDISSFNRCFLAIDPKNLEITKTTIRSLQSKKIFLFI